MKHWQAGFFISLIVVSTRQDWSVLKGVLYTIFIGIIYWLIGEAFEEEK